MGTIVVNEQEISDLNLKMTVDPSNGDILKLNGFAVIRRSLQNILTLRPLEKPFREDLGSGVSDLLFDVVGPEDFPIIRSRIQNTIERLEPRVIVKNIEITGELERNRINISIEYLIKNTMQKDSFKTFLSLSE